MVMLLRSETVICKLNIGQITNGYLLKLSIFT